MKKINLIFLFCFSLISNSIFAQNSFNVLKGFSADKDVKVYYQQFLETMASDQISGTETGNGGDVIRDFFIHEALKLLATLEKKLIFRLYYGEVIRPSAFAKKISIQNISVSTKKQLLDNKGSVVDAKVIKEGFSSEHLFLSEQSWIKKMQQYKINPYWVQRLILHEILRLNSISDDNYIITEQIFKHLLSISLEKPNIAYTRIDEQFLEHPNFNLLYLKGVDAALANSIFLSLDTFNLSDRFIELTFLKVRKGKIEEFMPHIEGDLLKSYALLLVKGRKSLKIIEEAMLGKYTEYKINKTLYPVSILLEKLEKIKFKLKKQISFLEEKFWLKFIQIIKVLRVNDLVTKRGFLVCEDSYTKGSNVRVILQALTKNMQSFRVMLIQPSTDAYVQVVGDVFKVEKVVKNLVYQLSSLTAGKAVSNKQAVLLFDKKELKTKEYAAAIFKSKEWLGHKGVQVWLNCTTQSEGVSFSHFQRVSYF